MPALSYRSLLSTDVGVDVGVTAQLRRKLTGPDRTLDTDVDAAASGLEQWLFARARSARDAPLQTNLARQPRLHNDAGSIDQRATDVIRWLGLPQTSIQSSAVTAAAQQERGRVHATPQQSLFGAFTGPQAFATARRSAVGAGWQRDRAAGGSAVDSAAAERASVTRALTHREKMETAATQRMLVRVCVCAHTHTCTHCHTHTLSRTLSHTHTTHTVTHTHTHCQTLTHPTAHAAGPREHAQGRTGDDSGRGIRQPRDLQAVCLPSRKGARCS